MKRDAPASKVTVHLRPNCALQQSTSTFVAVMLRSSDSAVVMRVALASKGRGRDVKVSAKVSFESLLGISTTGNSEHRRTGTREWENGDAEALAIVASKH